MKKILFLLLFTVSFYGQTLQNPTYGTVTEKNNATDNTPAYFTTTQVDGVHKKTPAALVAKTATVNDSLATKENVANKSDSYTASSSTTYSSTKALVDGLGTKQEIIYVTPEQFGAVGDGVTDDSTDFQNFLNSTLPKKILADKIYKIETELIINNPNNLDFNNSTLTSATLLRLLTIKSSDVYISNGNFISNMTGDYTVITEIEPYANSWLIGCKLVTGEFFENINIINSHFSTPNGSLNAVKLISHRSGFGGELKHINIKNNRFEEIGRMAVEVLGEGLTQWYSHVNISNNYFNDLGIWSDYGMAISLSGLSSENVISKNIIEQGKDVCIENAGANNTYILNNTVKNPKTNTTPMAINSGDSGIRGVGNRCIGNTFEDTYERGIQVIFQNNYYSENNFVEKANNLALINEVSNSYFISDTFDTTLNASVVIKNSSSNNKFINCFFSTYDTLLYTNNVVCEDTSTNNFFINSTFKNSTFGGNSLTQTSGATGNYIEKQIIKDNLTTLASYNISDAVTTNTAQTITAQKTFSGSYPSVSSFVRGFLFNPTLVQTTSYSTLIGVDLAPVFSLGSTTGSGGHIALRSSAKINYTSDISSTYDSRSLVDKGYADLKAPIASPTFTGTPTAPTATAGTNTTQIATTAFVQNIVSSGTFTPSSTGGITFTRCYWVKTGNVLDVVYNFSITGATSYTATMTLPNSFTINSNSNGRDIGGGKVTTNSGYSRLQETATSSDVYLSITSENTGTASGFARASILIN